MIKLSPSASYYIRQLLRQLGRPLSGPLQPPSTSTPTQTDVNVLLVNLYPNQEQLKQSIVQLESLVLMHQQAKRHSFQLSQKVEQEIISILALDQVLAQANFNG